MSNRKPGNRSSKQPQSKAGGRPPIEPLKSVDRWEDLAEAFGALRHEASQTGSSPTDLAMRAVKLETEFGRLFAMKWAEGVRPDLGITPERQARLCETSAELNAIYKKQFLADRAYAREGIRQPASEHGTFVREGMGRAQSLAVWVVYEMAVPLLNWASNAYPDATHADPLTRYTNLPKRSAKRNELERLAIADRAGVWERVADRFRTQAEPVPATVDDIKRLIAPRPSQPVSAVTANGGDKDTDWNEVQGRLLAKRERGEPYTSLRKLEAELGCSDGVIRKAIDRSGTLKEWQSRSVGPKAAPKATGLDAVISDNTRQTTEPAPDDVMLEDERDAALAQLLDTHPEARAQINAMSDEDKAKAAKLWIEQRADAEPSPLDRDKPDEPPRNAKQHKRL